MDCTPNGGHSDKLLSYGNEVRIGILTVNTGQAVRDLDPAAFHLNMGEYFSDDYYIEVAGRLFFVQDIKDWVGEQSPPSVDVSSIKKRTPKPTSPL